MKAMVLEKVGSPLQLRELPNPVPDPEQILIRVLACAVCRTDLHVMDGDLPSKKLPIILGHQIVGKVEEVGSSASRFSVGDTVGVPWLGKTCGKCKYCVSQRENLCDDALYTGYSLNGGFAEYCVANADYCFPIQGAVSAVHTAPYLCGGMVGFRAYRMTNEAKRIGFFGFGSSAHMLVQLAIFQKKEVYAFTRHGDNEGQEFAKKLGAVWAGDSSQQAPYMLDAAIIFAPVGNLVPIALRAVDKGGIVVCAGIHMSDIPAFPYEILWGEKILRSVSNLTRQDGTEFLEFAEGIPIRTEVTTYHLEQANEALDDLRKGNLHGTAVLKLNDHSS